ncbi:hypothetical protein HBB16_01765 [Pseudonocardia sp. MCCB 268]|nr:hypothetical protein [Pseudonocardia cytotoxica]
MFRQRDPGRRLAAVAGTVRTTRCCCPRSRRWRSGGQRVGAQRRICSPRTAGAEAAVALLAERLPGTVTPG